MTEPARGTTSDISVLICDDFPSLRFLLHVAVTMREGMSVVGEAAGRRRVDRAGAAPPARRHPARPGDAQADGAAGAARDPPRRSDAKIIILSGFPASMLEGDVIAHGVTSYMQKGVEPDEILDAIEAAVA